MLLQIITQTDSNFLIVAVSTSTKEPGDEPTNYSIKDRLLLSIVPRLSHLVIRIIASTCRFEVRGMEHHKAIHDAGQIPIYVFWHDRIFLTTYFWRNQHAAVLISQSKDGEFIARVTEKFGNIAIRGSSSRGGTRALVEMIRKMRSGIPMAITLDGPRGPRYEAKSGILMLAKKTGCPILPFVIEPKKYWRIRSWDRMQIPKPFTRAIVLINPPIYVSADLSDDVLDAKLADVQASMNDLVERGQAWRSGQS